MSCDECLLSLEEYVCGELEASASVPLSAHLADCGACASEHAQMRREQELYTRCEVKAPPTLWAAVLEKLEEEERPGTSSPFAAPGGWLAATLGGWQMRRGAAFAAALVLLACVVLLLFGMTRRGDAPRRRVEAVATGGGTTAAASPGADDVASDDRLRRGTAGNEPNRGVTHQSASWRGKDSGGAASGAAVAPGRAPRKSPVQNRAPAGAAPPAAGWSSPAAVVPRPPSAAAEIDKETARHFERARMLLRSFKNGRLSEDDPTFDIAYERRLSRELLGRNNILKSDAHSEGNEAAEKLLSRLEPFLLDIANLEERSAPEHVRSIKEQMHREGIIARLSLF